MKLILVSLLMCNTVLAAGGGGNIAELAFPAFNFVVLFGFMILKLRTPLRNYFDHNASKVQEQYERAGAMNKEAELKLASYQNKIENLQSDMNKVVADAEDQATKFEERTNQETKERLEKLSKDMESRLEHEKKVLIDTISEDFVNAIVTKAKQNVGTDGSKKQKASARLISQIR